MATSAHRQAPVRRRALIGATVGLPISALLLWLSLRNTDLPRAWSVLRETRLPWVLAALAGVGAFFLAQAARWRVLLRPVRDASLREVSAVVLGAAAISNTIPGRPGDLARIWWVASTTGKSPVRAASTVALDRIADIVVLVGALAVAASQSPPRRGIAGVLIASSIVSVVLVLALVASFLYVHSERGRARAESDPHRGRGRQLLSVFLRGLTEVSPREALVVLGCTGLAWLSFGLGAWASAQALGVSLSPLAVVMLTTTINLGTAIPSSPGFVGTYQWLTIATLEPYGITRDTAFAYSLLLHALMLVPATVIGYALTGALLRRGLAPVDEVLPTTTDALAVPLAVHLASRDAEALSSDAGGRMP